MGGILCCPASNCNLSSAFKKPKSDSKTIWCFDDLTGIYFAHISVRWRSYAECASCIQRRCMIWMTVWCSWQGKPSDERTQIASECTYMKTDSQRLPALWSGPKGSSPIRWAESDAHGCTWAERSFKRCTDNCCVEESKEYEQKVLRHI